MKLSINCSIQYAVIYEYMAMQVKMEYWSTINIPQGILQRWGTGSDILRSIIWNLCLSASAAIHEPQVLVNSVILLRIYSLLIGSVAVMSARYAVCCAGVGRCDCCSPGVPVIENNKNDSFQRGISQNGEAICKFENNRFRIRTGCSQDRMG